MRAAYLDASALVKLCKREAESSALGGALEDWPIWISTELVEVEAISVARRLATPQALERARSRLERMHLVGLTPATLRRAQGACNPPLRALDAIHLATALELSDELGLFFAYDAALLAAADGAGLPTASPG